MTPTDRATLTKAGAAIACGVTTRTVQRWIWKGLDTPAGRVRLRAGRDPGRRTVRIGVEDLRRFVSVVGLNVSIA